MAWVLFRMAFVADPQISRLSEKVAQRLCPLGTGYSSNDKAEDSVGEVVNPMTNLTHFCSKDKNLIMRLRNLPLILATLFGLASLGAPTEANAAFQVRLTDSAGGTITLSDGDGNGKISYDSDIGGPIGAYSIVVTSALTKPLLGSATFPHMDTTFQVSGGAPGTTLTIEVTDTGFITSPITLVSKIGGTNNGSSVTYTASFDNGNGEFGSPDGSAVLGPFSSNGIFGGENVLNVTGATPYSLTQKLVISGGGTVVSGDAELTAAPAPSSALLILAALPLIGLVSWMRRRNAVATAPSVA
jgi:hypothetical protein